MILSLFETKGVVIKTQDFKENDKLVWIFTEKIGKITVIAKGAKKSRSKYLSVTLPLCFADYMLFRGKNLYTLSEGKINNSFQGLLGNLEKLTYSSYLCELIDICLVDEESNRGLFKDFVTCLYLLNTDAIDYELLVRAFELKILKATGYALKLDNCVLCNSKMNTGSYISISSFGGVCEKCEKEHGVYISKGAYNALRFLNSLDMDKMYRVNITPEIKEEISKVTSLIFSSNYSKKPKSLEMLDYIKER
ncbi:DNA repair protein RecO [Clostridium sp. YIM B02551]|uniref:DNA repair protein RecO n=1 Tax=Clostridium sp. YIM B02551 TaxID=2910679 RepID=UPI001EEA4CC8